MNIRLDESWRTALAPEFDKLYFSILTDRIRQAYQHEARSIPQVAHLPCPRCLPPPRGARRHLRSRPLPRCRASRGLSLLRASGVPIPPSLINIKKEIASDLGQPSIHP